MTTTVVIPAIMSSNGIVHTYTDDSNPTTGLDGGGHVERLAPLILDTVYVANYALGQADRAASIAATLAQSPYTSATSSTNMTVATGSVSFALNETGKAFNIGQTVNVSNGTGLNVMTGTISSFDGSTGAITVNVTTITGAGTFSAWIVSIGALGGGLAFSLDTTGSPVDVSLSAPPAAKQLLTATSPTTAEWQDAPKSTPDFLLINAGIR